MTRLLQVAGAISLCASLLASRCLAETPVVVDFSTSDVCRGAEGIAFHAKSQTLMAVSGNGIYQFTTEGRLLRSYSLDEDPKPRLRGIHGLPSGNLLLVAENTHRLYEVTVAGKFVAAISMEPGIAPRGVAYSAEQNLVFVADQAAKSLQRYSGGEFAGQSAQLRVLDLHGIEVVGQGTFLILDSNQKKIFRWDGGREFQELIDLARICRYEEPDGLALDHRQGILYICFDESERIIGVDVSRALSRSTSATPPVQTQVQTPTSPTQLQIPQELIQRALVQVQQQRGDHPSPAAELVAPPVELAGPPALTPQLPQQGVGSSTVVVPSQNQPAPIIVRPQSPTIYILPIIIGNTGQMNGNGGQIPYQRMPASPSRAGPTPNCCVPRPW